MKTSSGVLDINPLEGMSRLAEISTEKKGSIAAKKKEFEELETKKKKEIEELESKKKKELEEIEKKKKELQDLEKKKAEEIEETEKLIERTFQELMRHKRLILQEENNQKKEATLEDITEKEKPKTAQKQVNYSTFFEQQQKQTIRLYDVANRSVYQNLTELRNKAAQGTITPEEEMLVENMRRNFDQIKQDNDYLKSNDQNQYVQRSFKIFDQINQYKRSKTD